MTTFQATTYDIDKPTGQCALTGAVLEPGEDYIATLVELTEAEIAERKAQLEAEGKAIDAMLALGLKRLDVSWEAWQEADQNQSRPERLFSHWKTVVAEPNVKKKVFVDDALLMNLLRRMEQETRPERLAFRFVLALVLMRKKLLRFDDHAREMVERAEGEAESEGQSQDQVEVTYWLLTPKLDLSKGPMGKWNEEEQFRVLDPKIDESRVAEVTQQLGEILDGEI